MKLALPCLVMILASSCMSPFGFGGLSPEQLQEIVKIKDASATCIRGVYAGALVTVLAINADKGIPAGVTIKESCEVTFSTVPPKP